MSEVEKHAADNISRILIGNKCDLEDKRDVSKEQGEEMAEHYGVRFLETSAKVSNNVEQAFTLMTREIKNRVQPPKPSGGPGPSPVVKPTPLVVKPGGPSITQKKKGCC